MFTPKFLVLFKKIEISIFVTQIQIVGIQMLTHKLIIC